MDIRNEVLLPDGIYHIYNRGINSCEIFNSDENYLYFLKKFNTYLSPTCNVYAYCLMPNHFHFLIKIKEKETIDLYASQHLKSIERNEKGLHSGSNVFSKQMSKFISCYTQSYNKVNIRHGSLLESPFKRIKVDNEDYLKNLILYIHRNPSDESKIFENYIYSSYLAITSSKKTILLRDDVLRLFGSQENFIYSHQNPPKFDFAF